MQLKSSMCRFLSLLLLVLPSVIQLSCSAKKDSSNKKKSASADAGTSVICRTGDLVVDIGTRQEFAKKTNPTILIKVKRGNRLLGSGYSKVGGYESLRLNNQQTTYEVTHVMQELETGSVVKQINLKTTGDMQVIQCPVVE